MLPQLATQSSDKVIMLFNLQRNPVVQQLLQSVLSTSNCQSTSGYSVKNIQLKFMQLSAKKRCFQLLIMHSEKCSTRAATYSGQNLNWQENVACFIRSFLLPAFTCILVSLRKQGYLNYYISVYMFYNIETFSTDLTSMGSSLVNTVFSRAPFACHQIYDWWQCYIYTPYSMV